MLVINYMYINISDPYGKIGTDDAYYCGYCLIRTLIGLANLQSFKYIL